MQVFASEFAEKIRKFNRIVFTDQVADNDAILELNNILSALLDFGERCPDAWSDADVEAPEQDSKAIYSAIEKRFPDFGVYHSCPPEATVIDINDATDDLRDIYCDLNEALWFFENGHRELGLWSAKLLFGHWGRHAINLKGYLHKKAYDW